MESKLVAIPLARLVVGSRRGELRDLAENPGIVGRGASDHHGVASGFAQHAHRVFGRVDVAVADDGHAHGLLHIANDVPIGAPGVSLRARARMNGDAFDADLFGQARDFRGNDAVFIPSGANLDGHRNSHGGAHGSEDLLEPLQIAQQARAAALDHFSRGAAEVDVHDVEAQVARPSPRRGPSRRRRRRTTGQ